MSHTTIDKKISFEQQQGLVDHVFAGTLFDKEFSPTGKGYLFDYFLHIKDFEIRDRVCLVFEAELGLGTRFGAEEKPIDVQKEIQDLRREIKKYQKLSVEFPQYVGRDGLTYKEVATAYEGNLEELETIKGPLLDLIKLQIKDRLQETTPVGQVVIETVHPIKFQKTKMHGSGIRLKSF
jgi:hypothetical protein